jgi:hypothetical protein
MKACKKGAALRKNTTMRPMVCKGTDIERESDRPWPQHAWFRAGIFVFISKLDLLNSTRELLRTQNWWTGIDSE